MRPDPGTDSTDPEAPALDAGVIDALQRLQRPGAPPLVERLVALYRADAPMRMAAIDAAIAAGRAEDLRLAAHPLKSSSAMLGAARLAAMAQALETCGREGLSEGTVPLAERARRELDRVLRALEERIGPGEA